MTSAVKSTNSNEAEHRREFATAINQMLLGRLNCTGSFTILTGTTTTVVSDQNAHANSVPLLTPASDTTLHPYVTARTFGSFTLTHAAAVADTNFLYALIG